MLHEVCCAVTSSHEGLALEKQHVGNLRTVGMMRTAASFELTERLTTDWLLPLPSVSAPTGSEPL